MPAVTEYIETTEALMDFMTRKLSVESSWTVEKFPGTNYDDLFKFVPELKLPAAVVIYAGSAYGNNPRRTAEIAVLVALETYADSGSVNVRAMLDRVIDLLDEQVLNNALWRVVKDDAVEISPNIASLLVKFEVSDF